jgi:glycosyltransferase involved in cell wall biosynthesis
VTATALPRVSVLVPSYNQGRYLDEALKSVFAQQYARMELLVLDGGSTDESIDVLKRYDGAPGFWWKSERDAGVVDAVNQGLSRATGEICGILSADDAYLPGAMAAAVAALSKEPSLGLVYADAEYVDAQGRTTGSTHVAPYSLEALLYRRTFIIQCSAFFRTHLAREVGGWRPEVSYVADNDLWLRLAMNAPCARVVGVWSRYRFHDAQRDNQGQRIVRDWQRAIGDLQPNLPPRLRRAARVGCYLTAHRYASKEDWWSRTRALYCVVATEPRCLLWREFPRIELLQPLRQLLSRLKRILLRWST